MEQILPFATTKPFSYIPVANLDGRRGCIIRVVGLQPSQKFLENLN